MILRYAHLRHQPAAFQAVTGLPVATFDALGPHLWPVFQAAEVTRLTTRPPGTPPRQRALGAGHPFALEWRDQVLLTLVWLRLYPPHPVLGYLFGVSHGTVERTLPRVLPVLEQVGQASLQQALAALADPARQQRRRQRRPLDVLLRETPALAVVIDTFEQRIQRPQGQHETGPRAGRRVADDFYSGKKKQHTRKTQVAVDEATGLLVDVPASVPGPTNDLTVLKGSGLLPRLPPGVGGLGDLGYVGLHALAPGVPTATPRRKPRNQPRPPADVAYNTAFARRRVVVEHTIGRLRRFQSLTHTDRHHGRWHTARTRAVAGFVNQQLRQQLPYGAW